MPLIILDHLIYFNVSSADANKRQVDKMSCLKAPLYLIMFCILIHRLHIKILPNSISPCL